MNTNYKSPESNEVASSKKYAMLIFILFIAALCLSGMVIFSEQGARYTVFECLLGFIGSAVLFVQTSFETNALLGPIVEYED